MALLLDEFVPLFRETHGEEEYQNNCFIAVVANLRHVLQPVMEAVHEYKWKDYVHHVRTAWNGEYGYGPGHNGQHDAAELLGEILHGHTSRCGLEVCVTKQVFECNHITERLERVDDYTFIAPRGRFIHPQLTSRQLLCTR